MTPVVLAYCETCGREFHTATSTGKFCDVPTCRGYLVHIYRGRHRAKVSHEFPRGGGFPCP